MLTNVVILHCIMLTSTSYKNQTCNTRFNTYLGREGQRWLIARRLLFFEEGNRCLSSRTITLCCFKTTLHILGLVFDLSQYCWNKKLANV